MHACMHACMHVWFTPPGYSPPNTTPLPQPQQSTNIPVPFVFLCKRACIALSVALVLRVCTYMVTLVPNPAYYCHPPYFNPPECVPLRSFQKSLSSFVAVCPAQC